MAQLISCLREENSGPPRRGLPSSSKSDKGEQKSPTVEMPEVCSKISKGYQDKQESDIGCPSLYVLLLLVNK